MTRITSGTNAVRADRDIIDSVCIITAIACRLAGRTARQSGRCRAHRLRYGLPKLLGDQGLLSKRAQGDTVEPMLEDRTDPGRQSGKPGSERTEEPEVGTLAWGWDQLKRSVRRDCCCSGVLVLVVAPAGLLLVGLTAGRAWCARR
jgi:hypothetical protein